MRLDIQITGQLLIGHRDSDGSGESFHAVDPTTNAVLGTAFVTATPEDIDAACTLAAAAFDDYRSMTAERRAVFLERIADGIEALGKLLIERAMAETGLAQARLEGERDRTTWQLRLFARLLRSGLWQQLTLDSALPDRQPLRRSDLRMRQIALGPVAVFGASNFPLAFSVAGGDTAAALAAGCPVVVKAHPSHPGTSELVGRALRQAVQDCGLPEGVFSMVGGAGNAVGARLVAHAAIQAVGFTGSRAGGLALLRVAQSRAQPIPVYAEMSSINPVFLFPAALAARAELMAQDFVDALVLGTGQFCTNPGVVFGLGGGNWDRFVAAVSKALSVKPAGVMLNAGIQRAYDAGIARLSTLDGLERVGQSQAVSGPGCRAQALVYRTSASRWLATPELEDEVFGPSSILVRCDDLAQMRAVAEHLSGQLTATMQIDAGDYAAARTLLPILERRVGRILANGFPTGVEVSFAMVHGGPFPATSDSRSTSVGASAISRFLRPVCYQDLPDALLPTELAGDNLAASWRLVDGLPIAP